MSVRSIFFCGDTPLGYAFSSPGVYIRHLASYPWSTSAPQEVELVRHRPRVSHRRRASTTNPTNTATASRVVVPHPPEGEDDGDWPPPSPLPCTLAAPPPVPLVPASPGGLHPIAFRMEKNDPSGADTVTILSRSAASITSVAAESIKSSTM